VTNHEGQNIITTLCGIEILEAEEKCNDDDDDDNDTDIPNGGIETANDTNYHEPRPQNPNLAISHPLRS
jgi:hypothetical protein